MDIEELKSALDKNPDDAMLWYEFGNSMDVKYSYETQKQYNEKLNSYLKAIALDPMFAEAYYALAKLQEPQENYQPARRNYEKVKQLRPDWKGIDEDIKRVIKLEEESDDRNIKYYEKVLSNDPLNPEKIKQLGKLYGTKGDHEKAISLLEYALRLKPGIHDGNYFLGWEYRHLKNYDKAIECFRKTLEDEPDTELYSQVYEDIGDCYSDLDDYKNALKNYKKSFEYHTDEFSPYFILCSIGLAYCNLKDYDSAIEYYNKALDSKPDKNFVHTIYTYIGEVYVFKKELETAKVYFEKAVKLKKDSGVAYYNLGYTYYHLGDYELAEMSYRMALQANYFDAKAHHNIGLIYQIWGDAKKAIEHYEEAIKIKPDLKEAYRNLAYTYGMIKDAEKVEENIIKYLELGGTEEDLINPKEK
jgi:tetratricopeptide (TPR) repeat protein